MITAAPRKWYSRTIEFWKDGDVLAVLEIPVVGRSRIVVGDERLTIRWRGLLGRHYVLESPRRLVAEATMPLVPLRMEVMAGDRQLTMRRGSLLGRTFRVMHGDLHIGTIRRRSPFSRATLVDLPDDLPVAIQAFLAFLVYAYWRRRARASG